MAFVVLSLYRGQVYYGVIFVVYCFFDFFFFFKQKTAYEMRISDWSSDVCSSDLLARHGGRVDQPRRQGFATGRGADRKLDIAYGGDREGGSRRHIDRRGRRIHEHARAAADPRTMERARAHIGRAAEQHQTRFATRLAPGVRLPRDQRSEEHPSELQSL